MPWGPVGKRVRRLLLALTSFLFHTRVFLLVGKYLGFGGIAWWKEQEGFRGAPGRWTINPLCHDTWPLRGAELQVLWWAEERLPGRAKESPALFLGSPKTRCHHLNVHGSEQRKDRKPWNGHNSLPSRGLLSFSLYWAKIEGSALGAVFKDALEKAHMMPRRPWGLATWARGVWPKPA